MVRPETGSNNPQLTAWPSSGAIALFAPTDIPLGGTSIGHRSVTAYGTFTPSEKACFASGLSWLPETQLGSVIMFQFNLVLGRTENKSSA